jgi:molybdate transport system substrate-binding protein
MEVLITKLKRGKTILMKKILVCSLILFMMIVTACSNSKNETELTISAAASMQEVLTELQEIYEKEHDNVKLFFNFGASGALQQQIEQGAPVDLFFSAASDKFNELLNKGKLDEQFSNELVGNELVLIQNKDAKVKLTGLLELAEQEVKHISIGTPETVPAGKYAKEALNNLNTWDALDEKIIYAKDVRQVLTYVETGNVDAGIVYKTDALVSKKVTIVAKVDFKSHSPIIYPLGVVKGSKHKEEAIKFYKFLQSERAAKVFEENGFRFLLRD